jgi:peptidoglycan/LPS O-acetylase OafA/YrhL
MRSRSRSRSRHRRAHDLTEPSRFNVCASWKSWRERRVGHRSVPGTRSIPAVSTTTEPPDHIISYRPEIDGLRAIAVSLVILVHASPVHMQNGFVGVDIFFVIPGFLITSILLTQLRSGSFSLRDFYVRRANRVFPALILVLAACIAFGWLALFASEFKSLGRSIAWGAGFAANINYFLELGYWDVSASSNRFCIYR